MLHLHCYDVLSIKGVIFAILYAIRPHGHARKDRLTSEAISVGL